MDDTVFEHDHKFEYQVTNRHEMVFFCEAIHPQLKIPQNHHGMCMDDRVRVACVFTCQKHWHSYYVDY